MAGQIPQNFIDQLMDTSDLVGLIGEDVTLKKSGPNYQAKCPFHDDRSPSFSVSPDKQVYHCFGCGASGNILTYVKEKRGLDFIGAVEFLAQRQGLEVPREDVNPAQERAQRERQRLYDLCQDADRFFQRCLRSDALRTQAVEYLRGRGLSGQTAQTFGIGVAPAGGQALRQHLQSLGYSDAEMAKAGVLVEKPGRAYDRFRGRVTFPIRDRRGRTVAFTARVLDDSKPKYLNSSESPIFHKGKVLYGLHEAIKANRTLERLIVVEGQMDVIALAQHCIPCAVATSGTAITPDHLEQLVRLVPQVLFCFDGDTAGAKAAWRALENALPLMDGQTEFLFLFLPEGQDPDSLLVESGSDGFNKQLAHAKSLTDVLFEQLTSTLDMSRLDSRARLGTLIAPHLKRVPKGIPRALLIDELARQVGTSRDAIQDLVEQSEAAAVSPPEPITPEIDPEPLAVPQAEPGYDDMLIPEDTYDHFEPVPTDDPTHFQAPPDRALEKLAGELLNCLFQMPELARDLPASTEPGWDAPELSEALECAQLIQDQTITQSSLLLGFLSGTPLGVKLGRLSQTASALPVDLAQSQFKDLIDKIQRLQDKRDRNAMIRKPGEKTAEDLLALLAKRKQKAKN